MAAVEQELLGELDVEHPVREVLPARTRGPAHARGEELERDRALEQVVAAQVVLERVREALGLRLERSQDASALLGEPLPIEEGARPVPQPQAQGIGTPARAGAARPVALDPVEDEPTLLGVGQRLEPAEVVEIEEPQQRRIGVPVGRVADHVGAADSGQVSRLESGSARVSEQRDRGRGRTTPGRVRRSGVAPVEPRALARPVHQVERGLPRRGGRSRRRTAGARSSIENDARVTDAATTRAVAAPGAALRARAGRAAGGRARLAERARPAAHAARPARGAQRSRRGPLEARATQRASRIHRLALVGRLVSDVLAHEELQLFLDSAAPLRLVAARSGCVAWTASSSRADATS